MAWVLHRKTTAAMAAFYAAVAVPLFYLLHDTTTLAVALFILFSAVLLAGNLYLRARTGGPGQGAPGKGRDAKGDDGVRPAEDDLRPSWPERPAAGRPFKGPLAPSPAPRDPESGRR